MWVLVYISLLGIEPTAARVGVFDDMDMCFKARDILSQKAGGNNGTFPKGSQAVCIRN